MKKSTVTSFYWNNVKYWRANVWTKKGHSSMTTYISEDSAWAYVDFMEMT